MQPSSARVTFGDAGHIGLPGTSSLPDLATARRAPSSSREANDVSGSATERSESSEAWSEERVRQLEEDKAAIERLWGEHAQENDIGVLKFKLVSLLAVLRKRIAAHQRHLLQHVRSRHAFYGSFNPSIDWVSCMSNTKTHIRLHAAFGVCVSCLEGAAESLQLLQLILMSLSARRLWCFCRQSLSRDVRCMRPK